MKALIGLLVEGSIVGLIFGPIGIAIWAAFHIGIVVLGILAQLADS